MRFVRPDGHQEVEVVTAQKRRRQPMTPERQEIIRDSAIALLSSVGMSVSEIGAVIRSFGGTTGSARQLYRQVNAAKENAEIYAEANGVKGVREPVLNPKYGVHQITPEMTCDHVHPNGPVEEGSHDYCESCAQTGIENHPIFKHDALDRDGRREWPGRNKKPWENDVAAVLKGGRT
jgi:hypothetical protein